MNRKPMLLKKLEMEGSGKVREVIGLIGTRAGMGVTYTAMMLAFYLGNELGRRTALIECNHHKDLDLIQTVYEWSTEKSAYFCFHNISFFKNMSTERIADILGEDYEYIIIDFGSELSESREEFLRCSLKAVVTGRSEWDILKLYSFLDRYETLRSSETWNYLIPQANDKMVTRLVKETRHRIWAVPFTQEPTRLNSNTKQFFKELLRLA